MASSELDRDGQTLVFGEESLLGYVRLAPDPDLQGRVRSEVADPLGVWSPRRADHRLAGVRVVRERHRDRLAPLAGLSTLVRDQQKGVVEKPPPAVVVQGPRHSHSGERHTSRLPAEPEQWPAGARALVSDHDHLSVELPPGSPRSDNRASGEYRSGVPATTELRERRLPASSWGFPTCASVISLGARTGRISGGARARSPCDSALL